MANGHKNGSNQEADTLVAKVLKVAAYPISGFVGWWVARNQIRHYTFQKLSRFGGLDGVMEEGEGRLRDAMKEAVTDIKKTGRQWDIVTMTRPDEFHYTEAIRERFEKLGLKNATKQSEFIYKPQLHKALLEGFTAAGISMGALLILANSKSLARAFREIEERIEKDEPEHVAPPR